MPLVDHSPHHRPRSAFAVRGPDIFHPLCAVRVRPRAAGTSPLSVRRCRSLGIAATTPSNNEQFRPRRRRFSTQSAAVSIRLFLYHVSHIIGSRGSRSLIRIRSGRPATSSTAQHRTHTFRLPRRSAYRYTNIPAYQQPARSRRPTFPGIGRSILQAASCHHYRAIVASC